MTPERLVDWQIALTEFRNARGQADVAHRAECIISAVDALLAAERASERERCAKWLDARCQGLRHEANEQMDVIEDQMADEVKDCAIAIRALADANDTVSRAKAER